MKYNWNTDDINEKMSEYALQTEESLKYYYVYRSMLFDLGYFKEDNHPKISRDEFFSELEKFDVNYFDNQFFDLITYISNAISDYELNIKNSLSVKKDANYIIKTCKDFYKRNDKESYNYFNKIVKQSDRIKFLSGKENSTFLGRSYILSKNNYYILINGSNYLEDTVALIHEGKHVENAMKSYKGTIDLYQELSSILYELYMIDYLIQINDKNEETLNLKIKTINKYITHITKMANQIEFIKALKSFNDPNNTYQDVNENYDLYYKEYNLLKIYDIMKNGYSQKEIGSLVSFIVAIDLYNNCKIKEVNNVLSCYMFGVYKLQPKIVDGVLEYVSTQFKPYKQEKIKTIYKKPIDKLK